MNFLNDLRELFHTSNRDIKSKINMLFIEAQAKKDKRLEVLIHHTLLELHMRRKHNYQVYQGDTSILLKELKQVKASFNPHKPLK